MKFSTRLTLLAMTLMTSTDARIGTRPHRQSQNEEEDLATATATAPTASPSPTYSVYDDDDDDDDIAICDASGASWGDACAVPKNKEIIENATAWWEENVEPFIPPEEKQYYQEPFGGATQPSMYRTDLRKMVLSVESNEQGVTYQHLLGGRTVGSRTPLHRHDFSATTHVLQGYVTLFVAGKAPETFGPGESYYMHPNGNVMTAAIMPKPIYKGKQVEQPAEGYSKNIDADAFPAGRSGTVYEEREIISDGEYFYWLNEQDAYDNCDEAPRYACQTDGYTYEPNLKLDR